MTHSSLRLGAIVLILTATAACTKPNSGNNNASMDASNAMTPPPAEENAVLESGNNVTNTMANGMSGNNVTTSSGNNVTN